MLPPSLPFSSSSASFFPLSLFPRPFLVSQAEAAAMSLPMLASWARACSRLPCVETCLLRHPSMRCSWCVDATSGVATIPNFTVVILLHYTMQSCVLYPRGQLVGAGLWLCLAPSAAPSCPSTPRVLCACFSARDAPAGHPGRHRSTRLPARRQGETWGGWGTLNQRSTGMRGVGGLIQW